MDVREKFRARFSPSPLQQASQCRAIKPLLYRWRGVLSFPGAAINRSCVRNNPCPFGTHAFAGNRNGLAVAAHRRLMGDRLMARSDPGLQPECRSLAWMRTTLTMAANALIALHGTSGRRSDTPVRGLHGDRLLPAQLHHLASIQVAHPRWRLRSPGMDHRLHDWLDKRVQPFRPCGPLPFPDAAALVRR